MHLILQARSTVLGIQGIESISAIETTQRVDFMRNYCSVDSFCIAVQQLNISLLLHYLHVGTSTYPYHMTVQNEEYSKEQEYSTERGVQYRTRRLDE